VPDLSTPCSGTTCPSLFRIRFPETCSPTTDTRPLPEELLLLVDELPLEELLLVDELPLEELLLEAEWPLDEPPVEEPLLEEPLAMPSTGSEVPPHAARIASIMHEVQRNRIVAIPLSAPYLVSVSLVKQTFEIGNVSAIAIRGAPNLVRGAGVSTRRRRRFRSGICD
jgi:hypothetical protein